MSKINELTVEELLGIVSQDDTAIPTLTDDKSNVKNFLRECGIKDGPALVPNYVLYYYYVKKWQPQGKKLSKIGFLRKASVVFNTKRTKNTRYYLLNPEVFDLSEEGINDAKEFDKRYRKKVAKNKQKRESKVSCTREEVQSENES